MKISALEISAFAYEKTAPGNVYLYRISKFQDLNYVLRDPIMY
jgi:hypothetical protein